jgi:hypothetical protein
VIDRSFWRRYHLNIIADRMRTARGGALRVLVEQYLREVAR